METILESWENEKQLDTTNDGHSEPLSPSPTGCTCGNKECTTGMVIFAFFGCF